MIDRRGFLRALLTGAVAAPIAAIGLVSGSEPHSSGGDIIVEPGAEDVLIERSVLKGGSIIIKGGTRGAVVSNMIVEKTEFRS